MLAAASTTKGSSVADGAGSAPNSVPAGMSEVATITAASAPMAMLLVPLRLLTDVLIYFVS